MTRDFYATWKKWPGAVENSVENVWKIFQSVKKDSLSWRNYDMSINRCTQLKALKVLKSKFFSYLYIYVIDDSFVAD